MKRPLKDFDNFAKFLQSTAIAYSLWERAFETQFDQLTAEWTTQLNGYQLEALLKVMTAAIIAGSCHYQ